MPNPRDPAKKTNDQLPPDDESEMLFYEGSDGELGGDGTPSGRAKERSIAGSSGQGAAKAEDVKDKDDKTSNRYGTDKNESGESGGGKKPA